MKRTADSSTTSEACPKSTSRRRRASGIAYGSIPTAITPSTPRRYGHGGSGQSNNVSTSLASVTPSAWGDGGMLELVIDDVPRVRGLQDPLVARCPALSIRLRCRRGRVRLYGPVAGL